MVVKGFFGDYEKYTVCSNDLEVSVITLGATVQDIRFKGKPLILNYSSPEEYLNHEQYVGATVGRFANRIKNSRFVLEGKEYILPPNDSVHQIHGGPDAFDKKCWQAEIVSENAVKMTYFSPDGENGFPGNLTASVTFTVKENKLHFLFEADTDKTTVYSPTTHMYFNLLGKEPVYNTVAQINTSGYLECDKDVVPTGKILPAENDFDFSVPRPIRRSYDDCIILSSENACTMRGKDVSVSMKTDFPNLLFYTWEFPEEPERGEHGFTLEPHFYPDSPNHPEWQPDSVLRPNEHFSHFAEYSFKTI